VGVSGTWPDHHNTATNVTVVHRPDRPNAAAVLNTSRFTSLRLLDSAAAIAPGDHVAARDRPSQRSVALRPAKVIDRLPAAGPAFAATSDYPQDPVPAALAKPDHPVARPTPTGVCGPPANDAHEQ
jgi:hypothetical protein